MFVAGITTRSAAKFLSAQQTTTRKLATSTVFHNASTTMAEPPKKSHKFDLPDRYRGSQPSVWVEYIQLAADHKPLNLGQGFSDYPVPEFIRKALSDAANSENPLMNQYTRGFGHPRLVQALAGLYSKVTNRKIDANKEVLVTVGAYEALYAAIQGISHSIS